LSLFLNEEQQQLAQHIYGPCICTAVAGSGKTTALVENLKNKIEAGINPAKIIATTFTKDAAENIKTRLEKRLGRAIKADGISTSHSIGYRIIREKCRHKLELVPSWKARKVMLENHEGGKYPGMEDDYQRLISFFKNRKLFPFPTDVMRELGFFENYENLEAWVPFLPPAIHPQNFHRVWTAYERFKLENNYIDFDDMLIMPYVLLRTKPLICEEYQAKSEYILVDEYQDTNQVQYEFFKLLAEPQNNIMVVGDDDQAIYSFRGAYPKYIRLFVEDYAGCKVVKLERNYRSQGAILDAANTIVVNNKDRYEKQLKCTKDDAEKVKPTVVEFFEQNHESNWIADQVQKTFMKGGNLSEIAVLTRTNNQLAPIEARCLERKIPYVIVGNQSFFEKAEVQAMLDYFRIAIAPEEAIAEIRAVANKPYRKIKKDEVDSWKTFQAFGQTRNSMAVEFYGQIQRLHKVYQDVLSNDKKHSIIVEELLAGPIGMFKWAEFQSMRGDGDDSAAENLMSIYDMACHQTIFDILDKAEAALAMKNDAEKNKNGVILSTIHRSKGLEWDQVYIPGCCDGIIPHKMANELEEERRLMYVAITRAKKNLTMSWFQTKGEKEFESSLFLDELGDTINYTVHEPDRNIVGPSRLPA
jgi:superfamily I DNA/RNA helicase